MSHERGVGPKEVKIQSASEFVRRVGEGEEVEKAVAATGADPNSRGVRLAFERAKAKAKAYYIPEANERKEFVIGTMLAIMAGEGEESKDKIAAARMLAGDPELGFQQTSLMQANFTQEVLSLPGSPQWKGKEGAIETKVVEREGDSPEEGNL